MASKQPEIAPERPYTIVVLGAGNVGSQLARHLHGSGHRISAIYSRSSQPAEELADELGTVAAFEPSEVPEKADFYLVAVPDDRIGEVSGRIADTGGIWLHTAGSVSMEVFNGIRRQYGVLYPLQSLQRDRKVSLAEVPMLVEGSSPAVLGRIRELARSLSAEVHAAGSAERFGVHVAAVFANNFSNHMVSIAELLLEHLGMDKELLEPLIRETFAKMTERGAGNSQTGPAARGDAETVRKHLKWLGDYPEWEKLYTFVSRDIGRSRGNSS